MVKKCFSIAILLIVMASIALAGSTPDTLTASVSRTKLGIHESLTLQLTGTGDIDSEPDMAPLRNDFDVVSRSQSSSVNIINGSVSSSKVWSYVLLPRHSGTLTIPPFCRDNICSQAKSIVVLERPTVEGEHQSVLLETDISSPRVMVQQQLLYTVRILLRQPLAQAGLSELKTQGVETTIEKVGEDLRYETERGGYNYHVIERKYALFPQHSGTLTLPPMVLDGVLPNSRSTINSRFSSRMDPFDLLGDQGQRIRVRSEGQSITIVDPPQLNNHQLWLPAKELTINDEWSTQPPTLTVGEPSTRTVTISARGLAAETLPELQLAPTEGFKSYPDKTQRNNGNDKEGVVGTLIQKIALVPTLAGTFTLPAVSMRWWNVDQEKWCTAEIPAITLKVLPSQRAAVAPAAPPSVQPSPPSVQPPPPAQAKTGTKAGQNISPLAPAKPKSKVQPSTTDLTTNIWLWICVICVIGWLTTIYLFRRKRGDNMAKHSKTTAPAPMGSNISPSLEQVIRHAETHNATETRRALNGWLTTLDLGTDEPTLDDFLRQATKELREEILFLDHTLYAKKSNTNGSDDSWNGTTLAQALRQWQKETNGKTTGNNRDGKISNKDDNELPSFYPKA